MEINIKPEDIDGLVKDALLKAAFGKAITDAVNKTLTGYNNPIDEQLRRVVAEIAGELLRTKFSDEIRRLVTAKLEQVVTDELLQKTVSAATDKAVRAMEESRY